MHSIPYYETLHNWGVIRATGNDAAAFLHSQLTQDVKTLTTSEIRLGAYCTAKGRMLASLVLARQTNGDIFLFTHRPLIASLIKRLAMFVLRAQCKLSDASETVGIVGLSVSAAQANALNCPPLPPLATGTLAENAWLAAWPSAQDEMLRYIAIFENNTHTQAQQKFIQHLHSVGIQDQPGAFAIDDLRAGIANITEKTVDFFIPQLLNLDLINGVNFQKGCYPGQEIIARTHYLGKQKRRMYRGIVHEATAVDAVLGQDIFSSIQTNEPAGRVINYALTSDANLELLFEVPMDLIEHGVLHLGKIDGPQIKVLSLPYPVVQKTS